jgi:hypothetical protein
MRRSIQLLSFGAGMALLLGGALGLRADFQGSTYMVPFDDAPFEYSKSEPREVVSQLRERIEKGEAALKFDEKHGYLPALLRALKVPASSQMLVFSKTSLQRDYISPQTPRAVFYNDDVYIGYIPGAPLIEISVADPKLGAMFYVLEQDPKKPPQLKRETQCLECHASSKSMGVPGHLVRSFTTSATGIVDFSSGPSMVNHRTPLKERWGGWYVTGSSGTQAHLGNLAGSKAFARHEKEPLFNANISDLKPYFNTNTQVAPTSDIVALMVMEHQAHGHNFLARLNYEAQTRIARYGEAKYMDAQIEAFLKYLLFTEEVPLTAPIKGSAQFAADFMAQGIKDSQGRSLRDFDLQTRLFKYPCSYLIYSSAFDGLPAKLRADIYKRLYDILSGQDKKFEAKNLSPQTRRAILEIIADTKKDLPDFWKK